MEYLGSESIKIAPVKMKKQVYERNQERFLFEENIRVLSINITLTDEVIIRWDFHQNIIITILSIKKT